MNKPISFELAKLVSEREISCSDERYAYNDKGELVDPMSQVWHCEAPTIGDMVTHLYETYGIWIRVDIEGETFNKFYFLVYRNHEERVKEYIKKINDENYHTNYKTPTEAYEAGIEYGLNHLI